MATVKSFEELEVWQLSRELVLDIYNMFGKHRDFAFRDQIQRAAVSIMNNIAEGFERKTNNEFIRFLYYSKGSAGEVKSMLYLATDLEKINNDDFQKIYNKTSRISKMLFGLITSLQKVNEQNKN